MSTWAQGAERALEGGHATEGEADGCCSSGDRAAALSGMAHVLKHAAGAPVHKEKRPPAPLPASWRCRWRPWWMAAPHPAAASATWGLAGWDKASGQQAGTAQLWGVVHVAWLPASSSAARERGARKRTRPGAHMRPTCPTHFASRPNHTQMTPTHLHTCTCTRMHAHTLKHMHAGTQARTHVCTH